MARRNLWCLTASSFLALLLLLHLSLVAAQKTGTSPWQTLTGNAPVVVANGGFSGLFPGSCADAYSFTPMASSPDTILLCDVRLTKDGKGVCLQDLKLDNCTNIANIYPKGKNDYLVNDVRTSGWFSVDFTLENLSKVSVTQGIYSRTYRFDYTSYFILTVDSVHQQVNTSALWLNIQHDKFYSQHNLSMVNYILSVTKNVTVSYISSPEVGFLRSIVTNFQKSKTKMVFRFLGEDVTEPSTNQTYGALSKNLTFIKTFASGILVPKTYIWPVTSDLYLESQATSIVRDAHKEGLEIYADGFANDFRIAFNYSYDPLAEYLSFIDNGDFSVDGFITDFPVTPSEAIGCYSHINKSNVDKGKPAIFSHNGASGDYPDCTDLAYNKAIVDGADAIDCPVQVTQDRKLVCMSSINLMDSTNVLQTPLRSRISNIPKLQDSSGIFTFNATLEEIQKSLRPSISNPEIIYSLVRNPLYKNAGNFMALPDFLLFAKDKNLSGILINIENAAFLAENIGVSVVDDVISALNDAGYNNQTALEVTVQSSNSSVLIDVKQKTKHKLMYRIDESIRGASASSIEDIKVFADSVAIDKKSIYPDSLEFIVADDSSLVKTIQNAGLQVFVYYLKNEFVSEAWDFFSDPHVEINSFVRGALVDGVITDFPSSASAYRRNSCRNLGKNIPNYMQPVQPGALVQLLVAQAQPPVLPPLPLLEVSDVSEPPLPPVNSLNSPPNQGNASAPGAKPSSSLKSNSFLSIIISILAILVSLLII